MRPFDSASGEPQRQPRRLSRPIRLLVVEEATDSRRSIIAMAKVLGVDDITVVDYLDDAFSALENADFDAVICEHECDGGPVLQPIINFLRLDGAAGAGRSASVIAKGERAELKRVWADPAMRPDVCLATPVQLESLFRSLLWVAARDGEAPAFIAA